MGGSQARRLTSTLNFVSVQLNSTVNVRQPGIGIDRERSGVAWRSGSLAVCMLLAFGFSTMPALAGDDLLEGGPEVETPQQPTPNTQESAKIANLAAQEH